MAEVSSVCRHDEEKAFLVVNQASPLGRYSPFRIQDDQELLKVLKQTHDRKGHPHNDQLVRVLRQAGASEWVLSQARLLQRSACQSHRVPKPHRVSALVPRYEFNTVVGMDVFHLQGLGPGQQIHVLSIVDCGTLYHVCILVREVTAAKIRRAYRCYSLRTRSSGAPQRVITDQGREVVGDEMAERIESDCSHHEIIPTESPWQDGRTETQRHSEVDLYEGPNVCFSQVVEELLSECCSAKNRYTLAGGFSPYQRVFGTQLRLRGHNFGDGCEQTDIGAMSALERGDRVQKRSPGGLPLC